MKEIKAVIQKLMFPKVLDALRGHPELTGLTISEVKGFGKADTGGNKGESLADLMESSPKIKLEIVVPDHTVEGLVEIIRANAHTGNPGDGKIFVAPWSRSSTSAPADENMSLWRYIQKANHVGIS